jgi:pimeloyl-ACP methyl ester carboxylesterase
MLGGRLIQANPFQEDRVSVECSIPVGDGRVLAYREYGDPGGSVVVNCHGGLLCGLDVAPFDATARKMGLRILSPDRPGLGRSSALPGRATDDWAADVRALLDGLSIERAAVFGWSMGGQYALACAALLPDRVSRTAVIAGCLPLDNDETFGALNGMDRRLTRLAQHHPALAAATFRTLGEIARHAPETWAHLTLRGTEPNEASAIEALPDPGIAVAAAAALSGGEGMVDEYRAWARPWGFRAADVASPVTIWHGDADQLVPPAWAEQFAHSLPDARLHRVQGAGHFLGYTHTEEVLASLMS